jgi:amidohydrolase
MRLRHFAFLLALLTLAAAPPDPRPDVDAELPDLLNFCSELHSHPEVSLHEERTAARLAERLRKAGFAVTEHLGGTGVVGVLRNGSGRVVMLRTELDALPVEEKTGLADASRVRTKDDSGNDVFVAHACGHDIHMTCWAGTAAWFSGHRGQWRGTLVFIAQPAEERAMGAKAMLSDGLLTRFPRPDFVAALHDTPRLPAGKVGYTAGPAMSNSDSVDLTIFGKGGHGAAPQATVDPIVLAARTVEALQTIVSRETNPLDPAVITVGSIHGGTKHNIIPDEVRLQLTVRSYREEVRQRILAAIGRIARGEAAAGGAPREPEMKVVESCPAVVNDPALTARVAGALRHALGSDDVLELPPEMASEDFSEYGRAGIPSIYFDLGAIEPKSFEEARREGRTLPSLHSPLFAPDREPAVRTGVRAEIAVLLDLLSSP